MNRKKVGKEFVRLLEIVETLRSPEGCAWDRAQTHETLLPYFLEETYEVIESIESNDQNTLKEELGDILLHVVLQSQIANENGDFNISDSIKNINQKLINRHPHVFGNIQASTPKQSKLNWEEIKHKEKNRKSRLDGVPETLPALARASRLQEKAALAGFDFENLNGVWGKIYEEIEELKFALKEKDHNSIKEEIGDVLFSIVNLARLVKCPPEDSLRKANKKFINRFQKIEQKLSQEGVSLSKNNIHKMNELWELSKEEDST